MKDPNAPRITLKNAQLQDETFFVFKLGPEDWLGKRLRITSRVSDEQQQEFMAEYAEKLAGKVKKEQTAQIEKSKTLIECDEELNDVLEEEEGAASSAAVSKAPLKPWSLCSPEEKGQKRSFKDKSSDSKQKLRRMGSASTLAGGDEVMKDDQSVKSRSSKNTGGQRASSSATRQQEEQVDKYVKKLRLFDILAGVKLGVSIRSGESECLKMPLKQRLQLGARLKLANYCVALSPDNLLRNSKAYIHEAIDALVDHDPKQEWPSGLQMSLFEMHVKPLVSHVGSSLSAESFRDLWSCIRPYSLVIAGKIQAEEVLNLKCPKLSLMTIGEGGHSDLLGPLDCRSASSPRA